MKSAAAVYVILEDASSATCNKTQQNDAAGANIQPTYDSQQVTMQHEDALHWVGQSLSSTLQR